MLLFCDSFDDRPLGSIGDRYGSYALNGSAGAAIGPGRTGNGLLLSTGILDVFDYIQWESETTHTSLFVGVARENNRGALCSIRYNGIPQIFAQENGDGTISVIRYDAGANTVLATSARSLSRTGWFYIELYGKIHTSAGAYELRVDGTRWLSASGLNTSSTGDSFANQVRLINNSALADGSVTTVDDFYIANDDTDGGDATVVGFLGPVKIGCKTPTGAGASSQWTPLSGSNYTNVDESGADSDTSFNATLTEGAIDLYAQDTFDVVNPTIKAVAVHQWAKKMDALDRRLIPTVRISGVNYEGDEYALGASYARVFHAFERSPATLAAWQRSEVSAAQFGATLGGV